MISCPFSRAVVSSSHDTGAPRIQGLHIGTWARRPPEAHDPSADAAAPRRARQQFATGWRNSVTYVDRTLSCVDCGVEFIHSAADQEYYVQKGFVSDPKRCTSCRASRR